jgi:hypothetical protein
VRFEPDSDSSVSLITDGLLSCFLAHRDEKFRNRQAKKGQSALLSDTAFDDDGWYLYSPTSFTIFISLIFFFHPTGPLPLILVEEFNIDRSVQKAQHLKDQGMSAADLSDHDSIDDPVEVFNAEKAEENKEQRSADFIEGLGAGVRF